MTQTIEDPMLKPYYSCDLSISIVNIDAINKYHAEAIMQKFIDEIAVVMDEQVRWDEADWEIVENVYDPETGSWFEQ
mgnify:CR=1 FL=1|jgi:hypothetical protein